MNKAIYEGVIPDINVLAKSIRRTSLEHATTWKSPSPLAQELWSPPPTDSFKVNFDIAIRKHFSV
jgi:hypothetical protein